MHVILSHYILEWLVSKTRVGAGVVGPEWVLHWGSHHTALTQNLPDSEGHYIQLQGRLRGYMLIAGACSWGPGLPYIMWDNEKS